MEFTFAFQNKIDLKQFLEDVRKCEHEVFFESTEGDKLALQSALSQFILFSICNKPELLEGAVIRGYGEHDRKLLLPYLI